MPKPVAVGDVIEVTIEATGSKGDGIAKKDGFVIFVKGASQGQTVKIKITGVGRSSATAEVAGEGSAAAAPSEPAAPAEGASEEEAAPAEEDGEDLQ
ncbi:TRAM domain protein [uncultured archaeon]|nr:TRAM domain protein [uncultured archaeon]